MDTMILRVLFNLAKTCFVGEISKKSTISRDILINLRTSTRRLVEPVGNFFVFQINSRYPTFEIIV